MLILGIFTLCFVVLFQECISADCGGLLTDPQGSFASPNVPNDSSEPVQCEWTISVEEGRIIMLHFTKFDVPGNTRSCRQSSVTVYDGTTIQESSSLGTYCNQYKPSDMISTGSSMKLIFKRRNFLACSGFHAQYDSTVVCEHLGSPKNGKVHIDSGKVLYFNSSVVYTCNDGYNLHGHRIRVCQATGEWSGTTPSCRLIECKRVPPLENGFVRYPFGRNVKDTLVYGCEKGYALQGSNKRRCQLDGEWTPVSTDPECQRCGGNLTSPTDVIMSPNYPNDYPTNTRCEWMISANERNRITLLFVKFSLEENYNCSHDNVMVYDGPNNFSMPTGPFCGSTIPSTIESSSYSMKIVFQSGSHTQKTGFMAVYYIKMAEDNSITGAGALHSEGENKIPYFVIIFGILLGITVLLIIGLVAYITFVHRRKHEDPMEMYDNPVYDSTSDVTSLTPSGRTSGMDRNRSARSTGTDTPEEMEIVDNLYYGSFEASGGDHGQGRANKSASKIGPITGDIYAEVQKDKPGQIYANQ